ncbi:MAG: GNAT family N-acetyltransferase [Pirellulaceae bacterium]
MSITIRPYRDSDLPRIQQLTVEAFEPVCIDRNIEDRFGVIADRNWAWRKARHLTADAEREPAGIHVAEDDGSIVGYITTWSDQEAGIGNIPNLAVDRDHRGQGLGRQLIAFALDTFKAAGLTHARIETLDQNSAGQNLYPSMGFREVARQIHYCLDLADRPGPQE